MTEERVTCPTAILARKKGFDWKCNDGYEWYMLNGKEYGPTELSMPEIPDVTMFSPEEREHPGNKELMRTLAIRKHILEVFFNNQYLAPWLYARPTQDLLERWLREVHGLVPSIGTFIMGDNYKSGYILYGIDRINSSALDIKIDENESNGFESYELVREAALLYALKLLPNVRISRTVNADDDL